VKSVADNVNDDVSECTAVIG